MSHLIIPYLNISGTGAHDFTGEVSALLDTYSRHQIDQAPWDDTDSGTQAAFSIAYNEGHIFLKYYVTEPAIKAEHNRMNEPVYRDSCVEFFIAFNGDAGYYNLEFNCAGNCLAQYGFSKTDRAFISGSLLKNIQHQTSVKASKGVISWELTLCIPKTVFSNHPMLELNNAEARVNFYKCGDDLQQPHYLCWSRIEAAEPEFHLSEFFKEVSFGEPQYSLI